jgi:hypothetical protein
MVQGCIERTIRSVDSWFNCLLGRRVIHFSAQYREEFLTRARQMALIIDANYSDEDRTGFAPDTLESGAVALARMLFDYNVQPPNEALLATWRAMYASLNQKKVGCSE